MYYNISFNVNKIRKLDKKTKLTYEQVGKVLGIDKEHFSEKDNWYYVDGLMQYFKKRQDSRIVGELLSDSILKIHGFSPAVYEISSMNDSIGLLSPNVHREGYRYESVATLHKLFPEFMNSYYSDSRKVTLKKILDFLDSRVQNAEELKIQIIRKYVLDWFTNQLDYNIRNMTFEQSSNGDLNLARIIDSESSFGATKNGLNSDLSRIWIPAIPAEDEMFRTGPYKIDNYDANIVWLIMEYPEYVIPLLKEITDTNYAPLINQYKESAYSGPVVLSNEGIDYLNRFIDERQEEAESMKKL